MSWLTALKLVPWGEVISLAPKVLDGAKKLRDSVVRRPDTTVVDELADLPEELLPRVRALEVAVVQWRGQMLESAELLKTLAEQNAQLIRQQQALKSRLRLLTVLVLVALMLAGWSGYRWAMT
jgi:hypothetical protein